MDEFCVEALQQQKFDNYEALEMFMEKFQKISRTIFTRQHSTTLENMQLVGNVNHSLVFYTVEYACKFGGSKFRSKSTGQRKTSTFRQNCPALIKLAITADRQKLEVTSVNLSHNHDEIPEDLYNMLPERRKLPQAVKQIVMNALKLQCNKKLLQVQIKEEYGIHVTTKDLWNLQNKFKNDENDIMKCVDTLRQKGADVEVLVDRSTPTNPGAKEELKAIYFSTADMRQSMNSWPHIVFLDGTYLLLVLGLTVMILMVEDSNGVAEIVGVGLLVKEDRVTFQWFLETFKKVNSSAVPKIQCFMGDKDLLERDLLKDLFPGIPVYICQFHVLRTFSREVTTQKYGINNDEKKKILTLLERLVKSSSENDYEKNYADFCDAAPVALREYFDTNWNSIKDDWAQYCMVSGNLGNHTNNRLESVNGKIKQVVKRKSSLVQFVKDFFAYIESHNLQTSYKLLSNFLKKSASHGESDECERNYMDYLTTQGFSQVLAEMDKLPYVSFVEKRADNQSFIIKWKDNALVVDAYSCECATFKSHMLPCRHIFAARRRLGLPLFEKNLCNERWTKDYYKKTQRVFNITDLANRNTTNPELVVKRVSPQAFSEKEQLKSVKQLTKRLQSIASECCGSRFDSKVATFKLVNDHWKNKLDFHTVAVTLDVGLVASIDTGSTGAKKKVISVPQKRRILQPLINDLVETVRESVDEKSLVDRTTVLQQIEDVWRTGLDVSIQIVSSEETCLLPSDSKIAETVEGNTERLAALRICGDEREQCDKPSLNSEPSIEPVGATETAPLPSFPEPVKTLGRPSLSLRTTVPKRRKKVCKFSDRSVKMQIDTMLRWILPSEVVKSVLDKEYRIQCTDIDPEDVSESFMSQSVKLDLIQERFDEQAFVKFASIIERKIEKAVRTCGNCRKELTGKSVACESCLLSYHFECVSLRRQPSSKTTWFCLNCKK